MNGLGFLLTFLISIAIAFPSAFGGYIWKVRKGYLAAKEKQP